MLRILFAGTPELACPSLEHLYAAPFELVGVLTQADQMQGRKRSLQPSAVRAKALKLGIEHIFCPKKLGPELRNQVAQLKPDLLVVFAYGKIFRQKFLDLFPLGGINLHPSALPQWRGPSPIEAQLRTGSKELGITVQRISLEMDAGDILLQKCFPMPADYYHAAEVAAYEGARMLQQCCTQIAALQSLGQEFPAKPQDHSKASYCSLIHKQDGLIDWQQSAIQIARNCRAYAAWPKTYTYLSEGETLQILWAHEWQDKPEEQEMGFIQKLQPGTLLGQDPQAGLLILCGQGILAVEKLQRQNRKPVSAQEFANQLRSKGFSVPKEFSKQAAKESLAENLYTFTSNKQEC